MNENEVFWLGQRVRSGEQRRNIAEEPQFAAAMKVVCQNNGCKVQRFVSAKGAYGTWLIEFERDDKNQRIVWNGRAEKMVLQIELSRGGWEEPSEVAIEEIDLAGFADGIVRLIGRGHAADE
jgi:hypothetical protein